MKNVITERMHSTARYFAKKYCNKDFWDYEEILQEVFLSYCFSDAKYDKNHKSKASFETFAIDNAKNHIWGYLKNLSKKQGKGLIKDLNFDLQDDVMSANDIDFRFLKDERKERIFHLRFNIGCELIDISKEIGVSIQRIKEIIDTTIDNKKNKFRE